MGAPTPNNLPSNLNLDNRVSITQVPERAAEIDRDEPQYVIQETGNLIEDASSIEGISQVINSEHLSQMLSNQYAQGISDDKLELPIITAFGGVEPVDIDTIQSLNQLLTSVPDRNLFLGSVFDPDNIKGIEHIFNLIAGVNQPLLKQVCGHFTGHFKEDLLFMFLMASPYNTLLFDFLHDLHQAIPMVRNGIVLNSEILPYIINIFMYYITKVGVDNFDTLIFQTDLINAYLKVFEYKYKAAAIYNHIETTIHLQETLRHAFTRAENVSESSQNIILNNRDSTNDSINVLSRRNVSHWIINTIAFTCFNLFVLNHFGFLPTPICDQVGSILENSQDQLIPTTIDNPIQLQDIYNLILDNLYKYLSKK